MINEYLRYRIEASRAEAFLSAYRAAESSLRASPHCLGYDLSRCVDEPEVFVLRIRWDSKDGHLQGFRKSAEFPAFLAAVKPFIGDILEMRHYEPTPLSWSR